MSDLTIGEKIKQFRVSANLNQLDLELRINASPGSISKIESGKTNPTKETVIAIAKSLNLQPLEVSYILGVTSVDPSRGEVDAAKLSVASILDSDTSYSYLLDNKIRVLQFSRGFTQYFTDRGVDISHALGKSIVEIIFDRKYGVRESIDPDEIKRISNYAAVRLKHEKSYFINESWWTALFQTLMQIPEFRESWDYASKHNLDIYSHESRSVRFKTENGLIKMVYSPIYLNPDPRFVLIEYLPSK